MHTDGGGESYMGADDLREKKEDLEVVGESATGANWCCMRPKHSRFSGAGRGGSIGKNWKFCS